MIERIIVDLVERRNAICSIKDDEKDKLRKEGLRKVVLGLEEVVIMLSVEWDEIKNRKEGNNHEVCGAEKDIEKSAVAGYEEL